MRHRNFAAAIFCLSTLSSCASYPSLYTSSSLPNMDVESGVGRILDQARVIQEKYAENYLSSAKARDFSQIPIVGAASAAAGILLGKGRHAANTVGYIGIGTATYSSLNNLFYPSAMPDLYIKGHAALACIRNEGALFAGPDADQKVSEFRSSLGSLLTALLDAKGLAITAQLDGKETAVERKMFQDALKLLNDIITSASTALDTGKAELGVYRGAEMMFGSAVSAVATKVATKSREGRSINYDELKKLYSANIPSPPTPPAPAAVGLTTNIEMIQAMTAAATNLALNAQSVVNGNPQYSASLARVSACPNSI